MTLGLRGGRIFSAAGVDPFDGDLVCADELISYVGASAQAVGADRNIDVTGLTVLPGLIDAHAHPGLPSPEPGANDVSRAETAAVLFRHCGEMLDAGFTTVRYTGGVDGGLARALRRGFVRGPRIVTAGPVLCQCGGHGHYAPTFSDGSSPQAMWQPGLVVFARVCDGADDVRRAAREAFRQGASFLKMCVTGGVASVSDDLGDTQFTVDEIRAAVAEASARGTYVTVHAHNNAGIRNALDAGAQGIEHGSFLNEENAARMAATGVVLVPTLNVVHQLTAGSVKSTSAQVERLALVEQGMRDAIQVALDAGVVVGAGSDLIGPAQQRRGLEVALRAEVTNATEAVTAMTATNADILGDDSVGRLLPGRRADVIAVDGDPFSDPALLADPDRVVLVVQGGVVVKDASGRVR